VEHNLVIDIAVCIIAAWVVAVAGQVARQPLLLAYLLAGFAIGPHGFRWVTDAETIQTISSIGLILLLFMIGLEIDLKKMASAGKIITLTGAVQILGCVLLGWLFFKAVGLAGTWLESLYLGVAAAMSSTVIIVKILYDKRELETLAGRITLGVLVLQDIATILFLALQPNLKHPEAMLLVKALGSVLLLVGVAFAMSRFVLPPIFKFVARLPELVLVGALAWCFAMAGFANSLGLSPEMGALIAGMMVSTFPYTLDVIAKVTSLRDFFVTLFFVGLGMTVPMPTWTILGWMLVFSVFVVVTRLLKVFPTLHRMRMGHRMSLLPAINLAQMSELSLVLLALGHSAGDVSDKSLGIAAFAFAFLAVSSTYAILHNEKLLRAAGPWLDKLGYPDLAEVAPEAVLNENPPRICFLGFSWTASSLLEEISRHKIEWLPDVQVIDFNPVVNEKLRRRGVRVVYGDISQRNVLEHAGVPHAEVIICTLPDMVLKGLSNHKLLLLTRELNPRAKIIVNSEKLTDIATLYADGADYVSVPRLLEADNLLHIIEAAGKNTLTTKREEQARHLEKRNEIIP
jgi:Kef-type K+ transport system membrane component KefB/Trk K+ transport system NAD-binding subunit